MSVVSESAPPSINLAATGWRARRTGPDTYEAKGPCPCCGGSATYLALCVDRDPAELTAEQCAACAAGETPVRRVCAWCEVELAPGREPVSHGICPACMFRMLTEECRYSEDEALATVRREFPGWVKPNREAAL